MKRFILIRKWAMVHIICLSIALTLAACGGDEEPLPTTVPTATSAPIATAVLPTETPAPTATVESMTAASAQPVSPLDQPISPLVAAVQATSNNTRTMLMAPGLSDMKVIQQLVKDTTAGKPEAGKGAVSAMLYSPNISRVLPGTQYYLMLATEVEGLLYPRLVDTGPQPEKGDIVGMTDVNGIIKLTNVPPGKYFMSVMDVYQWPLVYTDEAETKAVIVEVKEGKTVDLGLLYVPSN